MFSEKQATDGLINFYLLNGKYSRFKKQGNLYSVHVWMTVNCVLSCLVVFEQATLYSSASVNSFRLLGSVFEILHKRQFQGKWCFHLTYTFPCAGSEIYLLYRSQHFIVARLL